MKSPAILFALLAMNSAARGNLYVPNATLAGETVHARLMKDAAAVTAVFEFNEWITRDEKVVYFPIFADDAADPVQVLARSGLEFEISGEKVGIPAPCEVPQRFRKMSSKVRVCWFSANLDDLADGANLDINRRIVIKVSYSQPLIRGHFYYLPSIVGGRGAEEKRSWRYQMLTHSSMRVPRVLSKETDYEQLADGIVIYLKDGEIVDIQ